MPGFAELLKDEIQEIVLSEDQIARRVRELGEEISRDYQGKEVVVVSVLKGAVMFVADLVRHLTVPCSLEFMAVSSYGASTDSSGVVRIIKDLDESIEGRHVLVVEDIIDTGLTLNYLRELLLNRKPASLRICTLLNKPERRAVDVPVDYVGFDIPNEFVVGYGLDYAERYRNVPFIAVLRPEVYNKRGEGA